MPKLLLAGVLLGALPAVPLLAAEPAAPVTVATVEHTAPGASLVLPGTVLPRRSALLSVEVAGVVAELAVDDGDVVRAGDVLLRLRDRPQILALEAARADLRRAQATAGLAAVQERRQLSLLAKRMTPEDSHDQARAQHRQARADLAAARARVALLEDELARHVLKAPFDGVIARKRTELGAWVRPGDGVLELVETGTLWVEFALPQVYFGAVREGTPVMLRFDAVLGDPVNAQVSRLIAVGQEAARTFRVRIALPNPNARYAPGMSVDVTLPASDDKVPVPSVLADALVRSADGRTVVWVVQGEGNALLAAPVPVQPGRIFGDRVELLGDAPPLGTRVVVQGNERLRPGQALRIVGSS